MKAGDRVIHRLYRDKPGGAMGGKLGGWKYVGGRKQGRYKFGGRWLRWVRWDSGSRSLVNPTDLVREQEPTR